MNRDEVKAGVADLGVELWEHVERVLQAMQGVAEEPEVAGNS